MQKITTKWKSATAAATLAGALALSSGASFAETEVTAWSWDPNFNGAIMQMAMDRYSKSHPDVSLQMSDFGNTALEQKLQSQLASGATDGLPDIVLLEDYSAQRFLLSFPGAFEPIGEHVDLSVMAPYKVAVANVDGVNYSMPFDSGVTGLFYRPADLEAAGFTADDLKDITWDRLIEIGKAVEEKTGKKFLVQDFNSADLVRLMLQSAGIWYITPEGEVTAETDPRFEQVIKAYVDVMQSGIIQDVAGWENFIRAFTQHEVSGVAIGAWITAAIKANEDQAGTWAVAPIPRIEGIEGASNYSSVGGSSWYVLANSANKDVALDFMGEIWAKDVGFYEQILKEKGAIGSLTAAADSPAYQAPEPFFGGQPVAQDLAAWLGQVPDVNYGVFTAEAEAAFTAYFPEVLRGNMAFEDAMSKYTTRLKQQVQ